MMQAADIYYGAQMLTILVPWGTLFGVVLWIFFQRHPTE
jgi:hypothetical protein